MAGRPSLSWPRRRVVVLQQPYRNVRGVEISSPPPYLVVPKTDRSRDGVTTGTQCFVKCLAKAMIGGPAQKYSNRNGE